MVIENKNNNFITLRFSLSLTNIFNYDDNVCNINYEFIINLQFFIIANYNKQLQNVSEKKIQIIKIKIKFTSFRIRAQDSVRDLYSTKYQNRLKIHHK